MKLLIVGDPHTLISNLDDSQKLLDFIRTQATANGVDGIVFTGDLFHTHAVIRQEILHFWRKNLTSLSTLNRPIMIIAGNHDMPGSQSTEGEITAIENFIGIPNVIVVNDHLDLEIEKVKVGLCAYTSSQDKFLTRAHNLKQKGCNILIAHQTFTGAKYSNGFYAEDGIDPALVPQDQLISGHIHSTMQIGKCFYVGSPKADNMADANVEKGIWVTTHTNLDYTKKFISTEGVVTSYKKFKVTEGEEIPELNPVNKNYLELEGSNAWIVATKKKLKGIENLQIKAVPTDVKISTAENKNQTSIYDYLKNKFKPVPGISIEQLTSYIGNL